MKTPKKAKKKYGCGFIIAIKTGNRTKITAAEEWIVGLTAIVAGAVVVSKVYRSIKNAVTSDNSYSGSSGSGSSSFSGSHSSSNSGSGSIDPENVNIPESTRGNLISRASEGRSDYRRYTFSDDITGYVYYPDGKYAISDGGVSYYYYATETDAKNALYVFKKYGKVRKTGKK
jgi:hypothetical protein